MFSNELQLIISVVSEGTGAYQFTEPAGIGITDDDCIVVDNYHNHLHQVLTMKG